MKIIDVMKGWISKMGVFKSVKTAFKDKNIPALDGYYENIHKWEAVYKGNGGWTTVTQGGLKKGTRKLNQMNAAKLVCGELLNITFSGQVDISISDGEIKAFVDKTLNDGGFWKNFPTLIERSFALGGAVLKAYLDNGAVKLDYVPATRFVPLSWNDVMITECVFISSVNKDGRHYNLHARHKFADGTEIIENDLYCVADNKTFKCCLKAVYPNMEERVEITGLSAPTFAYFKPNGSNNIDFDTPLGVSVFANAIDTLKSLDVIYDSLQREYVLGKKRIIVPVSAIKTEFDENGMPRRYFDTSDEVYQAFSGDDTDNLKIIDNTADLRIDEHIKGINAMLDMLCVQVGLTTGSLSFDSVQGVRTATEIISQNNQTHRTVSGHQNIISEAIEHIVRVIIELGAMQGQLSKSEFEVSIHFDDGVVVDKNAEKNNAIKLVAAGLMTKADAMIRIFGFDEETAQKKLKQIAAEKQVGFDTAKLLNSLT
jgi:A118 family predicted phage portal protein